MKFSEVDSEKRAAEELAFIHFGDFLDECEGKVHLLVEWDHWSVFTFRSAGYFSLSR